MRTIWVHPQDSTCIQVIDQRFLPHELVVKDLFTVTDVAQAIKEMWVRGAPLIGVSAAYGIYLAVLKMPKAVNPHSYLQEQANMLKQTRPTAINLMWAIDQMVNHLTTYPTSEWVRESLHLAGKLAEDDVITCYNIGLNGLTLLRQLYQNLQRPINILTHCNAGWLGCVDYGTATAPMYLAHDEGIPIHVWVDETRPRNQGANLTAWELGQHGIAHTLIVDNVGGLLMLKGMVDICIVGSDRTTITGDVANKIGTYLKALSAKDNNIPFYVALPSSTFDWSLTDGVAEIPIEERNEDEVHYVYGTDNGVWGKVRISPITSKALNYGFDVTPSRLVTGLITERGICNANEDSILNLFPERKNKSR
jgi:methylthioribose-1-phosphate isomerase